MGRGRFLTKWLTNQRGQILRTSKYVLLCLITACCLLVILRSVDTQTGLGVLGILVAIYIFLLEASVRDYNSVLHGIVLAGVGDKAGEVLKFLYEHPSSTTRTISERLRISETIVATTLSHLQDKGFVSQHKAENQTGMETRFVLSGAGNAVVFLSMV